MIPACAVRYARVIRPCDDVFAEKYISAAGSAVEASLFILLEATTYLLRRFQLPTELRTCLPGFVQRTIDQLDYKLGSWFLQAIP